MGLRERFHKTPEHKQHFCFIEIHQKMSAFPERLTAISGTKQKYICCLMSNNYMTFILMDIRILTS